MDENQIQERSFDVEQIDRCGLFSCVRVLCHYLARKTQEPTVILTEGSAAEICTPIPRAAVPSALKLFLLTYTLFENASFG